MLYPTNQVLLEKLKVTASLETRDLIALETAFADDPALLNDILMELLSQNFEQSIDSKVINAIVAERYKFLESSTAKERARISYQNSLKDIEKKQYDSINGELMNIVCDTLLFVLLAIVASSLIIYFNKTDSYPLYIILIIVTIAVLTVFKVSAQTKKFLRVRKTSIPSECEIAQILAEEDLMEEVEDENN